MSQTGRNQIEDEILLDELAQILRSPEFVRSPVMSNLLTYLVKQHIESPDAPPKAYEIAVDALGKNDDFDVQADSYPRVQVGRLRNILKIYYSDRQIKSRISIPLGNYSIYTDFSHHTKSKILPAGMQTLRSSENTIEDNYRFESSASGEFLNFRKASKFVRGFHSGMSIAMAAVAALSAVIWLADGSPNAVAETTLLQNSNPSTPPKLFITMGIDQDQQKDSIKKDIENHLVSSLGRFESLRLAMSGEKSAGQQNPNAYELEVDVLANHKQHSLQLRLIYMGNQRIIWTRSLNIEDNRAELEKAVQSSVSELASVYGIIPTDQRNRLTGGAKIGYSCLLKFDEYRATRDAAMLSKVDSCIAESLKNEAYNSQILAAASFMAYLREEATGRAPDPSAGSMYAERAAVRGRDSALASFALARSSFFIGECRRAKRFAQKAAAINPLESTIQAQTGAYLSACDDPEAETYLRNAIELDPHGSIIAETGLVLTLMSQGRDEEALEIAEQIIPSSVSIGPYYDLTMAMVLAKNGQKSRSQAAWRKLYRVYSADDHEQADVLVARLITNEKLANRALNILREANVITS